MRQVFLDTFDLAGQLVERALVGLVRNQRLALRNSLPDGFRLGIGDGFLSCRSRFGGLIGGFLGCCGFLCRGSRLVLSSGQGRLQGAQLLLQRGSRLAQFGLHVPDVVVVVLAAGVSQRRPDQEKRQNSVDKNSLHSLWIKLFELNKIVSECVSPPP